MPMKIVIARSICFLAWRKIDVRFPVSDRGHNGLVLLSLSFVADDPKADIGAAPIEGSCGENAGAVTQTQNLSR